MFREKWPEKGFIKLFYQHSHVSMSSRNCAWEKKVAVGWFSSSLINVATETASDTNHNKNFSTLERVKFSVSPGRERCHDEINLITKELNLICLLAIFQVIKITET